MNRKFPYLALLFLVSVSCCTIVFASADVSVTDTSKSVVIENDYLKIEFSKNTGMLTSFKDLVNDVDLRSGSLDADYYFWGVELMDETFDTISATGAHLSKDRFSGVSVIETDSSVRLELIWSKINYIDYGWYPLEINITVLVDDSPYTKWYTSADNDGDYSIEKLVIPSLGNIGHIGEKGENDRLIVPCNEGRLYSDPINNQIEFWGTYPSAFHNLQFFAYYDESSRHGFYFMTEDPSGSLKQFIWMPDEHAATTEIVHFPSSGFGESYSVPYATVIGVFTGDWYDAAQIYKNWTLQQSWASETLKEKAPEWLLRTPISKDLETHYSRHFDLPEYSDYDKTYDDALYYFEEQAGLIDVPSLSFFWGWENGGSWAHGEWFPPSEGWDAYSELNENAGKLDFTLYPPITEGDVLTESSLWQDGDLVNSATLDVDGEARKAYPLGSEMVIMCPYEQEWAEVQDDAIIQLIEAGTKAVQIDGFPFKGPPYSACYDVNHGHDLGEFSNSWVEAWHRNLDSILSQGRSIEPDLVLGGEGHAEPWIPEITICHSRDNWEWESTDYFVAQGMGEYVPLYAYVFHEYVLTLGEINPSFGVTDNYHTSLFHLANTLSWGEMPSYNYQTDLTQAYFEDERSPRVPLEFLEEIAWARVYADDFLVTGQLVRPPVVTCPLTSISGFETENVGVIETDSIQSSCFNNGDQYVVTLASIVNEEINAGVELSEDYGEGEVALLLLGSDGYEVLSESETLPWSGVISIDPYKVNLLKIVPANELEMSIQKHSAYLLAFDLGSVRRTLMDLGITLNGFAEFQRARELYYTGDYSGCMEVSINTLMDILESIKLLGSSSEFSIETSNGVEAATLLHEYIMDVVDSNRFSMVLSMDRSNRYQQWTQFFEFLDVNQVNYVVEPDFDDTTLAEHDLLMISSNKDITAEQVELVIQYLERGGRLWLILDSDVPDNIKTLVESLGYACHDGYVTKDEPREDEGSFFITEIDAHSLTSRIDGREHIWPIFVNYMAPLKPGDSVSPIMTMADTWSEPGGVDGPFSYLSVSEYGDGKTVLLADNLIESGFVDDQQVLLKNILIELGLRDHLRKIAVLSVNEQTESHVDLGSSFIFEGVLLNASSNEPLSGQVVLLNGESVTPDNHGVISTELTSDETGPIFSSLVYPGGRLIIDSNLDDLVWDSIIILDGGVSDGITWFKTEYAFSGDAFTGSDGKLYVNDAEAVWSSTLNRWEYSGGDSCSVTSVTDNRYGLSSLTDEVGSIGASSGGGGIPGYSLFSLLLGVVIVQYTRRRL